MSHCYTAGSPVYLLFTTHNNNMCSFSNTITCSLRRMIYAYFLSLAFVLVLCFINTSSAEMFYLLMCIHGAALSYFFFALLVNKLLINALGINEKLLSW